MSKQLVVYMSPWCGSSLDTQRALKEWGVLACFVNIKEDRVAAGRVKLWTGFESVPTLVIVDGDHVEPVEPPTPLPPGRSPRGVDRGSMITEPTRSELRAWLVKHGLLEK
jgi:glutaredoxin